MDFKVLFDHSTSVRQNQVILLREDIRALEGICPYSVKQYFYSSK